MILEPLRIRILRLEAEALSRLEALPEYCHGTMLFDAAGDALETGEGLGVIVQDIRRNLCDAIHERDGYDTWEDDELDALISFLRKLAKTFDRLVRAIAELHAAEVTEINLLRLESKIAA